MMCHYFRICHCFRRLHPYNEKLKIPNTIYNEHKTEIILTVGKAKHTQIYKKNIVYKYITKVEIQR